nr:MAG TPA: Helix-turn-helix of insertion element transposase [Caudoviricetes sp.]
MDLKTKKEGDFLAAKSNRNRATARISNTKRALAEMLCDPECKLSISEMCRSIGIARSTYYKWLADDEYSEYLDKMIDRFTDSELPTVWKALIKRASAGNVEAMKLYFEMKGRYKQEIEVYGGVVFVSGEEDIRD